MPVTLDKVVELAEGEARRRGFRSMGIFHLLWAVRDLDPETFRSWLVPYRIDPEPFIKMLEAVLRPRRAGGGLPRDREEAELMNEALRLAGGLAARTGSETTTAHLGPTFCRLKADPLVVLCERYCLRYQKPPPTSP